ILKILLKKQKAVNLMEIEQQFDQVDRSTIFRTLKTFQQNCVIHKIDDGTGAMKFALCDENCSCLLGDLHAHFYCSRCGQTTCLKNHLIENPSLPENFFFESANFVIKGICADCR
ncbi:MAG: transcriptional repressor, partial [Spirochaetales bacterium]|nr:transcriptional repressor [Spirochaetales bacterium]